MNFIEVYTPITKESFLEVVEGNIDVIFSDNYAKDILSLLKNNKLNGNFGNYKEVLEISLGIESYTPSEFSGVHNIKITAFLDKDADREEIYNLVKEIIAIHPWEHPVMSIWMEDFRMLSKKKPEDFLLSLKNQLKIK